MLTFIESLRHSLIACCAASLLLGCASTQKTVIGTYSTSGLSAQHKHLSEAECTLYERRVGNTAANSGPLFISVNGVPTTSLIYKELAHALVEHLDAQVLLVDLPGTGGSRLDDGHYNWSSQRDCLRHYLLQQPTHTLIVNDAAGPVLLPLLGNIPGLQSVVVFNTVLKPSRFNLPFPMNCLRSCLFLSKPVASVTPFWFYNARLRSLGIARDDQVSREQLHTVFDELRQDDGMRRLVDVLRGFELTEATDELISSGLAQTIPQLFIWGMRDPVLGGEIQHLTSTSNTRQIQQLDQAKHYPMLDFSEETATIIEHWYRQSAVHPQ